MIPLTHSSLRNNDLFPFGNAMAFASYTPSPNSRVWARKADHRWMPAVVQEAVKADSVLVKFGGAKRRSNVNKEDVVPMTIAGRVLKEMGFGGGEEKEEDCFGQQQLRVVLAPLDADLLMVDGLAMSAAAAGGQFASNPCMTKEDFLAEVRLR